MSKYKAFLALLTVVILWGSSFPVIKIVVTGIGGYRYTWVRGLIAFAFLTPFALKRVKWSGSGKYTFYGGLITGAIYMAGLWLQGVGTSLTTASNSAFITGLNVVFVHLYVALIHRRYSGSLGAELILALIGLYLLTSPRGGFNLGDLLVLLGAIMWAGQVILVSKYDGDPIVFTWAEMLPSITLVTLDMISSESITLTPTELLGLTYLGIVCSGVAFTLQVYGQKTIKPEIAALTYLLEPVFASIFSWIILGEVMNTIQLAGATLILIATGLANKSYLREARG